MPLLFKLLIVYALLATFIAMLLFYKYRRLTSNISNQSFKVTHLSALLAKVPAPCVLTDERGLILYANSAYEEKCGYTLSELENNNIAMLKASIETDYLAEDCWQYLLEGKVWQGPFINQTKLGEIYTQEFTIFPVILDEKTLFCALSYNVANHYLEEKALEQIQRQSIHFKDNFISNLSHEVRTPLNALIGLSQLGIKNEHPERHSDYFSKINIASKQLMQLMDDILDFSKIESGHFSLVKNRFNFMSLLSSIISQYATKAAEKNLEFNIYVDEFSPQYIYADAFRIEQIFSNLTSNAIKFTASGEVNLSIGLRSASTNGYEMSITITDTGEGMSDEVLEGLFNPFSHLVTDNQKRHNRSSGLGMAITKQIVDLMHGSIAIYSEPMKGTSITVILPFDGSDLELPKPQATDTLDKLSVLVIDDSETSQENAKKILNGFGYETTLVSSGQEAIDLIKQGKLYSLIMIDWRMPGLSSERTVIEITKYANNRPRILFITPFGSSSVEVDIKKLIHGYLPKPFTPSMLFDEIAALFVRSEMGSVDTSLSEGLFKNLSVLLVDDNAVNNTISKNLFESEGAKTVTFTKATRALEYLSKHNVDFIVSDIDMPEMNGYEFLVALRQSGFTQKVSALTANTSDENRQDILTAGFDAYISKPLTKEKLSILHETLQIPPRLDTPTENMDMAPPLTTDFSSEILHLSPESQVELDRLLRSLLAEAYSRKPKPCKDHLAELETYFVHNHLNPQPVSLLSSDLQKYRFKQMIDTIETLIAQLGGILHEVK